MSGMPRRKALSTLSRVDSQHGLFKYNYPKSTGKVKREEKFCKVAAYRGLAVCMFSYFFRGTVGDYPIMRIVALRRVLGLGVGACRDDDVVELFVRGSRVLGGAEGLLRGYVFTWNAW